MSASSIGQAKHLLRTFLLADADLRSLVGNNVYGAHLEDADAGTVLQESPIVVFEFTSGSLRWHAGVSIQVMEVYAYSKRSLDEASQVYDAITSALQHERVFVSGIDPVGLCRETTRPMDGYNIRVDGWFLRGRWVMEVS